MEQKLRILLMSVRLWSQKNLLLWFVWRWIYTSRKVFSNPICILMPLFMYETDDIQAEYA